MTIEGAIKRFESLIAVAEDRIRDFELCWPSMKSNFRKDKELYEMAVSALCAQADTLTNAPLTLEELREMNGEPVWVQEIEEPKKGQWRIIKKPWYDVGLCLDSCGMLECEDMGKTWIAYRRKPDTQKDERHETD